jgi:hypothetical protein
MIFLFDTDNSAKLLWNTEGASGTLHIPNVHKFLNHLEIARICFKNAQKQEHGGLAAEAEDDRWINAAEADRV